MFIIGWGWSWRREAIVCNTDSTGPSFKALIPPEQSLISYEKGEQYWMVC